MSAENSEERRNQHAVIFEKRLTDALNVALGGNTALVIVSPRYPRFAVLTLLVQRVPEDRRHLVRRPGEELHFEGTAGSVRVFSSDHIEYDRALKHIRGYPHGIPTFLHPEVEGL